MIAVSCSPEDLINQDEKFLDTENHRTLSGSVLKSNTENSISDLKQIIIDSSIFIASTEMNEQSAKLVLQPIIYETLQILYDDGITEQEIIESFGSLENPAIALVGIGITADNTNVQVQSEDPDPINCLGRAYLGMDLQKGFWSQFSNRRVMLRAIGKAASRTLGWVGTALLVYDFADCMGWLD